MGEVEVNMESAKKILALIGTAALLVGCSAQQEDQALYCCADCGESVEYVIMVDNADSFCAKCFMGNGFMICRNCGDAYTSGIFSDAADGYCRDCTETETWFCAFCENRISLDDLADLRNGYYLCGKCLLNETGCPDWLQEDVAARSPIITRDEYLLQG